MPQVVFAKAVKKFLPTAIPTRLEKIDEYAMGKVLVYSKRPRKLLPMRKHELDFTGWSMQSLLAENETLTIATARSYLFDTGKDVASKSFSVDIGGDLDVALAKLASASGDFKFNGGEKATLKVTTDFGKITHISTDLLNSMVGKTLRVQKDHPIVKKALANGGVMFIISTIYEGERCNVKATVSKDVKESTTVGGGAEGVKADVKEDVDDRHSSATVVSRNQPTPLAYMLMKVTVNSNGTIGFQLNKRRFSQTLEGSFITKKAEPLCLSGEPASDPYQEWVVIDVQSVKTSEAQPPEAKMVVEPVSIQEAPLLSAAAPVTQPSDDSGAKGQGANSEISHPYPTPLSEIPSAKVDPPIPRDNTDGMPDEHYLYSLKDFQPFDSTTYRGIVEETREWVVPFVSNTKLKEAFLNYTKLPGGYEKLNSLSAYFLDVGNAIRADETPPPNKLKDVEPIMATLSEGKEVKLNEVSSVVIVAEAADEFPQHVLKKIFELAPDKRKILNDLILATPYGTSRHTYADSSPFKDPALNPIMKRMGFSIVTGSNSLTHIRKDSDDEEDTLVSAFILLLASEKK